MSNHTPQWVGAATGQPLSLSAWRERAQARERRNGYLARAYACRDMAVQALDAHDAQLLRAMTIVWQLLADKGAGVHGAAAPELPPDIGASNKQA
jgi:hypothetical protein